MNEPQRYESAKHFASIAGFVLDVVVLVYLLRSGASLQIRRLDEGVVHSQLAVVAIYTLSVGAIFKVVDLPFSFYSGYFLEHRFGLSRQSLGGWIKDQLKAVGLGAMLGVGATEVIYGLLRARPDHWWIYASLAFIAFVIVMANLAPVLLLPLFFKFRPVENPDLENRVSRLARQ